MTYWMPPAKPAKRKVFISYYHRGDQGWFDYLTRLFGDIYEIFYDQSLDGRVRSDDPEYVNRRIREDYIVGSSLTIVLCGAETWKRKYVDWEIYSTLHHEHALLGIALPTAVKGDKGSTVVPARLHANVESGYAYWMHWTEDPALVQSGVEAAIERSRNARLIDNSLPKMTRNRP
jgi:hypothetical protein